MSDAGTRDPLDREQLAAAIAGLGTRLSGSPEVVPRIDSTNSRVASLLASGHAAPVVCVADAQTAGRGRRGRTWVSPAGCNIYLSVGFRGNVPVAQLPAFALVAAAEVVNTLRIDSARIKWPNDVLIDGAKLAGVLCESAVSSRGPVALTVGIGINVRMSELHAGPLDRRWTTMEAASGKRVSRGAVAAELVHRLCQAFPRFEQRGITPWLPRLRELDGTSGRDVSWERQGNELTGRATGIADDGRLIVAADSDGQQWLLDSGEVRQRPILGFE